MEYTKGEWIITRCSMADATIIANDLTIQITFGRPMPLAMCEANAHLISQSPKMYELLDEIYTTELDADTLRILQPWFDKVEKALAKAGGK